MDAGAIILVCQALFDICALFCIVILAVAIHGIRREAAGAPEARAVTGSRQFTIPPPEEIAAAKAAVAKPACGCGHDLAFHEGREGGGAVCRTQFQCECAQYTGPRLLDPGYVARELAGE